MSLDLDNLTAVAQVVAGEGAIAFGSDMAGVQILPMRRPPSLALVQVSASYVHVAGTGHCL